MTTQEKNAVLLMAAKYEKYGITFITLLRMFGEAPRDKTFMENYKAINEELKNRFIVPERANNKK